MATIQDRYGKKIEYCQVDTNTCREKNDITPSLVGLATNLTSNAYGTGKTVFQRDGPRQDLAETCKSQRRNPPCPRKPLPERCERVTMLLASRTQLYPYTPFLCIGVLLWRQGDGKYLPSAVNLHVHDMPLTGHNESPQFVTTL